MSSRVAALCDWTSVAVLFAVSCIMAVTFGDYGMAWDETWHMVYGDLILDYFATGGEAREALSYRRDYLYGGAYDLLGALFRRAAPLGAYDAMHLLGATVGLLGFIGTWKLGREVGGPAVALVALLALVGMPVYYGHTFNNPKDTVFAAAHVWCLYYLVRVAGELPRVRVGLWARLAAALGVASAVRIAGLLGFGYLALIVLGSPLLALARGEGRSAAAPLRRTLPGLLACYALAWLLMVAPWPWALQAPLSRPIESLQRMSDFVHFTIPTLFRGEWIELDAVPWIYLPEYYLLQNSEVATLLTLLGIGVALSCLLPWWRRRAAFPWGPLLVVGAACLPPSFAIARDARYYDGLRHFLFVLPSLAVCAGLGLEWLVRTLGARSRVALVLVGLALVVGWLDHLRRTVSVHPYQYAYFNRSSGGLAAAKGRYETSYYGVVYRELLQGLAGELWRHDPDAYLNTDYSVWLCGVDFFLRDQAPPNFRWEDEVRRANFFVGYDRMGCDGKHADRAVVYEVRRDGARLGAAKQMRLPGR